MEIRIGSRPALLSKVGKLLKFVLQKLKIIISVFPFIWYFFIYIIKKRGRQVEIIQLYSVKFGHFYTNTECYLRDDYDPTNKLHIFYLYSGPIDTIEIKRIWEKIIKIHSYEVGVYFAVVGKLLKWRIIDYPQTFPRDIEKYRERKFFIQVIPDDLSLLEKLYKRTSTNKHICVSIRDSQYQLRNQDYDTQQWRDCHVTSYIKSFLYLIKKNYSVVISNRNVSSNFNIESEKFFDYSKNMNYSLEEEINYIRSSEFYIAGATGIDLIPLSNAVPILCTNFQLGTSLPTRMFFKKNIVVPQKVFSTKKGRFITLSEYLQYLRFVQDKYKIDRFDFPQQYELGLLPMTPSEDEILEGVKEIINVIEGSFVMNTEDQDNQERFWGIYPKEWRNVTRNKMIGHSTPHYAIISPYFLRKNHNWLDKDV